MLDRGLERVRERELAIASPTTVSSARLRSSSSASSLARAAARSAWAARTAKLASGARFSGSPRGRVDELQGADRRLAELERDEHRLRAARPRRSDAGRAGAPRRARASSRPPGELPVRAAPLESRRARAARGAPSRRRRRPRRLSRRARPSAARRRRQRARRLPDPGAWPEALPPARLRRRAGSRSRRDRRRATRRPALRSRTRRRAGGARACRGLARTRSRGTARAAASGSSALGQSAGLPRRHRPARRPSSSAPREADAAHTARATSSSLRSRSQTTTTSDLVGDSHRPRNRVERDLQRLARRHRASGLREGCERLRELGARCLDRAQSPKSRSISRQIVTVSTTLAATSTRSTIQNRSPARLRSRERSIRACRRARSWRYARSTATGSNGGRLVLRPLARRRLGHAAKCSPRFPTGSLAHGRQATPRDGCSRMCPYFPPWQEPDPPASSASDPLDDERPAPRSRRPQLWGLGERLTWVAGLVLAISAFTGWYPAPARTGDHGERDRLAYGRARQARVLPRHRRCSRWSRCARPGSSSPRPSRRASS